MQHGDNVAMFHHTREPRFLCFLLNSRELDHSQNGTFRGPVGQHCNILQLHDLSHDLVHVQTLVHEWHDAAGLSNGFTAPGKAIAIYFHRFDDTAPNKKYAHILLPDDWIIKILSYTCTQWTWRSFPRFGLASRQKLQQWSVVTVIQA